METYLLFVTNAILGDNTPAVEMFYKENEQAILDAVKLMQKKHPVKTGTIYRGILLDQKSVVPDLKLKPLPGQNYLSFTEDIKVAEEFAGGSDEYTPSEMKDFKGYIIEHIPGLDEILFHYSWIDILGIDLSVSQAAINLLREQKEIILKQKTFTFTLRPVSVYSNCLQ